MKKLQRIAARTAKTCRKTSKYAQRSIVTRFALSECMAEEATRLNQLSEQIIGAAIDVHRAVGPGLLESAYQACLYFELVTRGLSVERQKALPLIYKGVALDCSYRMDLVVESSVVVEVKTVGRFESVHDAQMDSYLRLADLRLGLMLNFHVYALKDGIRRRVNRFPAD